MFLLIAALTRELFVKKKEFCIYFHTVLDFSGIFGDCSKNLPYIRKAKTEKLIFTKNPSLSMSLARFKSVK